MKKFLYFYLLLLLPLLSLSQEKIPLIDPVKIIEEIQEEEAKGDDAKALALIEKINPNDSTYCSLLTSKAYYLINLEKYDEVIKVLDDGEAYDCGDSKAYFYINKGVAYAAKEDYEKAIEVYEDGLKHFPKFYKLWNNKGTALEKLDRLEDAAKAYQKTITLNPFFRDAHLKLGNICYQQGKITQALMCYNIYILLNPDGDGAFETLRSLNDIVSNKNENEGDPDVEISEDDEYFEDIDLVIDNKIALNKDYKIDHKVDIALIRQNHAMLSQLENYEGTDGFWSKKYVQFYKWIQQNDLFEDFSYTLVASIENKKYKKQVKRKEKDIIEFLKLALEKWKTILSTNTELVDGEEKELSYFYQGTFVEGLGEMKNGTPVGKWEFYNSYGRLTGAGSFAEDGERDGAWKWYNEKGRVRETASYKNGKLDGKNLVYYEDGSLYVDANYVNGELEGEYKYFNEKGAMLQKKYFKNGKLNGKYISYFKVGELLPEYDIDYVDDYPDGKIIEYYADGKVYREIQYENGKAVGVEKRFSPKGDVVAETNYKDDNLDGAYVAYHTNGKIKEKGTYLDDKPNGTWFTYYDDETIQNEYTYVKGKLNGLYKEYDTDGKIHFEYVYRKGEIISYKFFDKAGKIIKQAKKKGGEFLYKSYSPQGNITSEGVYDIEGGKKGDWKFYTKHGVLSGKGSYKDGNTIGEHITYYKNGQQESITNYDNEGVENGYHVTYYKDGQMKHQCWFKDGKEFGEYHDYYVDGTIENVYFYHKGKLHGIQKEYTNTGKLERNLTYKYGILLTDEFFDNNEKSYQNINYLKDGKDGILSYNFTNKKPNVSSKYVNGVKHGLSTTYSFYGKKRIEGKYLNGNEDGKWTWYDEDGKIQLVRNYYQGNLHGETIGYHENGTIERKEMYNRGDEVGLDLNYYENGQLEISTPYKSGEEHGRKEFFCPLGNLQLVRFYDHGRLIGYSYLGTDGKEKEMIPITNETGTIKAFYDNGKVSREMEVKYGDFTGTYNSFYYSGKPESKITYKNGEYDGNIKEYYQNGNLKNEKEYKNGQLHGKTKLYHENGQLKMEANVVNDEITGEVKHYDEAGKHTKTEYYFNGEIYESKTL